MELAKQKRRSLAMYKEITKSNSQPKKLYSDIIPPLPKPPIQTKSKIFLICIYLMCRISFN